MNRLLASIIAVSIAAVVLIGCQQTPQRAAAPHTSPGALPALPKDDTTPHVTAATYFAHGDLLERQGDYEKALVQYQKAIELRPDFVSALNRMGITLNKLARHQQACEAFERAVRLSPDIAYLHNNLGFSLYLLAEYEPAERELARALQLKTDYPRARLNHALVLGHMNRFDDAYKDLLASGELADAQYNMGMLLTESGYYPEAAKFFEAALASNPKLEAAQQQLASLATLAARNGVEPKTPLNLTAQPGLEPQNGSESLPPNSVTVPQASPADLPADITTAAAPPVRHEPPPPPPPTFFDKIRAYGCPFALALEAWTRQAFGNESPLALLRALGRGAQGQSANARH